MKDLSKRNKDYAVFVPAISTFYTHMLSNIKNDSNFLDKNRMPDGFENGADGLNFMDPEKGYYFYDSALYSAGHACLDTNKGPEREEIIYSRDKKKTTMISDSGGYQVGTGQLKFDWNNFYEKKGDKNYKGDADKVRLDIMRWQEATSEYAMTLDVPSWAALKKKSREVTGIQSFQEALDGTKHNLDFIDKNRNRDSGTKFLNVLQGNDWEESQIWYEAVKDYPFEGWSFGGQHAQNMYVLLRRMIVLRDDGMLEQGERDWIHLLGKSKLDWACFLTLVQRQVRKSVNPDFTLSYDCASPFIAAAYGLTYTAPVHTAKRFSYIMSKAPQSYDLAESSLQLPFESEIMDRCDMGDLCWYREGDLDKNGKEVKTSWDTLSYTMIMAHNVYQHIRAVQLANAYMDVDLISHQPDISDWKKLKPSDTSNELSKWVPRNVLYFATFVEELFKSDKPITMLDNNQDFLANINGKKSIATNNKYFHSLFEREIEEKGDDSFNSGDEERLMDLEKEISKGEK